VKSGEKAVICGEVGSGKSTLIGAVLADVAMREGKIKVSWKIVRVPERMDPEGNRWIISYLGPPWMIKVNISGGSSAFS